MKKRFVVLSFIIFCLPAIAGATVAEGWVKHIVSAQAKPIYLYVVDMDGDGAITAEEIAVSILAELIRARRGFQDVSASLSSQMTSWFDHPEV